MEQYTNLPGFFVEMADDGLQIMPTVSITDSVLLIGTADSGPEFSPVRISRLEEADAIFGNFEIRGKHSGVSLLLGAKQAFGSGCRDIRLVRIPHGTRANRALKSDEDAPLIKATAFSYGESYNSIMISIVDESESEEKVGSVIKIWNRSDVSNPLGNKPTAQFSTKGKTLEALVKEMNEVARLTEVIFSLEKGAVPEDDADEIKPTEVAVALGLEEEGSNKGVTWKLGDSYSSEEGNTLRSQLAKAYNYLSDYTATVVVPLDVYYDPESGIDAIALADFCAEANVKDSRILGVISAKPLEGNADIASINSYVESLTNTGSFSNTYPGPNGEDHGKFISVVVGQPIFYNSKLGLYTDSAAASYAGLIATLLPHSATTNKVLSGSRGLKYKFYPSQLEVLTDRRFVTLRQRPAGVAVTDGMTAARALSDFSRLSTLRIANAVIDGIKQVTEPFIGEALDSSRQQSIETAIESILADLKSAGALEAYRFGVYFASSADRIRGILTVEVAIVPAFEVRRIKLKLTLKPTM